MAGIRAGSYHSTSRRWPEPGSPREAGPARRPSEPVAWGTSPLRETDLTDAMLERAGPLRLLRVQGSAGAFLSFRLRQAWGGPILVLTPSAKAAEHFANDLRSFQGAEADIAVFPAYDVAPFDRFSPHPELEARRMSLLYRLLAAEETTALTLVAPWPAILRRVLPRAELRGRVTHLERGTTRDRDALVQVLVQAGYQRTSLVEEPGEVAARGGILDLFPPHLARPVRLDFEFDEIGSIRSFDPVTQRSEQEHRSVVAIPPRSFRLPADPAKLAQRIRALGRSQKTPESNIYQLTEALSRRQILPGTENLEALLHDRMETFLDYLPAHAPLLVNDPERGRAAVLRYTEEIFDGHALARQQDRLVCDPLALYLTDTSAAEAVSARAPVYFDALGAEPAKHERAVPLDATDHRSLRAEIQQLRGSGQALRPLAERIQRWRDAGLRIRLACSTLSSAERLRDILNDYGLEFGICGGRPGQGWAPSLSEDPGPGAAEVEIVVASVREGFELPLEGLVIVTEQDLFGERSYRRPVRATRRGQALDQLAQIEQGDYLVHVEHGVGSYGGMTQLDVTGIREEFLLIRFAGSDRLYLPISRLGQIQLYSGADSAKPSLDRLGGRTWKRTRSRVQRAVRDMARELIAVQAAREATRGHAYPAPDTSYEEFEARFPYDDTPDQRAATEDVLRDLQRERPMDRLVCGDVGFGKTEVACRAAYLVAAHGRQVAFLVPTTVLCQQHTESLRVRFEGTGLNLASLSRLSTPSELRRVREGLASGRLDIVIGTHRLLSQDVQFRQLGLLIIDEEHRFGVAHKERFKQIKQLVEVLTLTATPIPRTLQMALSGMRDLSLITTPPPDRVSIRTQICNFSDDVIREVILRELRRGGQTFFVHNRVSTISEFGEHLRALVPEAGVRIAHGQMSGMRLEEIMLAFVAGEFDVLLCTSIIESGLDIPNANTILIHRAERFGLAQLYQLRGRVGRSDRRAYAYLFLPPEGRLSPEGRQRIEAIQDLSELGAGYRLATHDLEIRGAGNLLGGEQSGYVAAVGYDLFLEMLEQAVAELRGQGAEQRIEPEIKLPIPALLPEEYVDAANQRLVFYKQLSSARDGDELAEIRGELLDRYGPLPAEALSLFEVIRLKLRCRDLGIESLEASRNEIVVRIAPDLAPRIDPSRLVTLLGRPGTPFRVDADQQIHMRYRGSRTLLAESFGLLDLLAPGSNPTDGSEAAPGQE